MPFYSSNEKLKRKRIAKESNKQLNIGSGSGEETTQPTETFTYREPKLFFNLHFTGRFVNNIQVSDYPRRFRSANVTLPLELYSVSIVQNGFQISLDEENSIHYIYPDKSFQQMVDDGDISIKWFMDSVEVVGETNLSLDLDQNNGDQGKTVYSEVTNNVDASVVTSNTITIAKATWTPSQLTSLTLWLDASDELTIVKDVNNKVSQWDDKSGNNNNATQVDSAERPSYSGTLNGLNTVYFDGTSSFDFDFDWFIDAGFHSSFVVISGIVDFQGIYGSKLAGTTASDQRAYVFGFNKSSSNYSLIRWGVGYTPPVTQYDNTGSILNYTWDVNSDKSIVCNAVLEGSNSASGIDYPRGGGNIGNPVDGSGFSYLTAYVSEIIMVDNTLTTEIKEKVEGYLAHKWNLTDKLPTNHPYKTTAL